VDSDQSTVNLKDFLFSYRIALTEAQSSPWYCGKLPVPRHVILIGNLHLILIWVALLLEFKIRALGAGRQAGRADAAAST